MPIQKFDEIHVQRLKISGADKIEAAVEVTDQVKEFSAADADQTAAIAAVPEAMYTVLAAADEAVIEDLGAMTEAQSTALATVPAAMQTVLAAADEAVIEDLGAMTEAQSTALATVDADMFTALAALATTMPYTFAMTKAAGTGGAGTLDVTISPKDVNGDVITAVQNLLVWVSDDAQGEGVASTWDPDSIVAATGTVLTAHVAAEVLECQTDVNGVLTLTITDAQYATLGAGYVAIKNPMTGAVSVLQIEVGDYATS